MNWWGKVVGAGIGMVAGPLGSLVGASVGHIFDQQKRPPTPAQKARLYYLGYFFSCAAKIAKANGAISREMIEQIEMEMSQMCEDEKTKDFCMSVFRKSKSNQTSITEEFSQLAQLIQYDSTVAHSFLGGLYKIARADGKKLSEPQIKILLIGETELKLPRGTLLSWVKSGFNPKTHPQKQDTIRIEQAYAVIGAEKGCSMEQLKKCYRQKANEFHPDKITSKGLPKEFSDFANDQLSRINSAYELIKSSLEQK
ncbi:MAG: DnaJ domain-containing protein [Opitutales bacterium]